MVLQLPVQSGHITTKVAISNPVHRDVYSIQHYVIQVCHWLVTGGCFFLGTPVSSIYKNDRHDISDILLKVVLNTINKPTNHFIIVRKREHLSQISPQISTYDGSNQISYRKACTIDNYLEFKTIYIKCIAHDEFLY